MTKKWHQLTIPFDDTPDTKKWHQLTIPFDDTPDTKKWHQLTIPFDDTPDIRNFNYRNNLNRKGRRNDPNAQERLSGRTPVRNDSKGGHTEK